MTIKLGRNYLFILAVCTFLWNQQTSFITQKIAIENSYQQKVFAAVSRMLGQEKFLVIVNIEYSTVGGTLKKAASSQLESGSSGGYIPGLPTVPTNQDVPKSYNSASKTRSDSDFEIGRVEVTIGMDETSITGSVNQEIKSLIKKIIPQTKDCDDCIKIEVMTFQSNQKTEKLKELEAKIDNLENAKRKADLAADSIHLVALEKQLTEATNARNALETMAHRRELKQMDEDSIRFAQLVAAERTRKEQDSLRFVNTEKRLERVMESKIKSDSVIISEAMSLVKQQAGGSKDGESLMGMQIGSGSSSIMGYVLIIFLVISLMIATFLAANNKKPKTIYLKPKDKEKENKKDKKETKAKKDSAEAEGDDAPEPAAPEPAAPSPPSPTRPDEDAMRSELRSLRQTAVSLTVGEKEGASALIKEWLEDNPNKEEEGDEGAGEE